MKATIAVIIASAATLGACSTRVIERVPVARRQEIVRGGTEAGTDAAQTAHGAARS